MSQETLLVEFGPGLAFRFERLPDSIAGPLRDVFGGSAVERLEQSPLIIRHDPAACGDQTGQPGTLITIRDGISAYQNDATIYLESPGIRAWCNTTTQEAGLYLTARDQAVRKPIAILTLLSIVGELALTCGWYCMHAAAVAIDGKAVLLPAESGSGKSTIYRKAAAAGFDTLSDDLVWLRESGDRIEIRPLPRGSLDALAPPPSIDKATMAALVCPSIVDADETRLEPINSSALLQILDDQCAFLASRHTAQRFRMFTQMARTVPAYRLAAGRDRDVVPALLRALQLS